MNLWGGRIELNSRKNLYNMNNFMPAPKCLEILSSLPLQGIFSGVGRTSTKTPKPLVMP
jgi:hypothetical protein